MPEQNIISKGLIDRIGQNKSELKYRFNGKTYQKEIKIDNIREGLELIVKTLITKETPVISDTKEIDAAGHRVVHGGTDFDGPAVINKDVIASIRKLIPMAPLHNPPDLEGIEAARDNLPHSIQIACFDTAFHRTIPEYAYIYGLPYYLLSVL